MTRWPQHLAGSAAAQQVGVVDAVPTPQHRVDQGQQLAAGPVRASQLAQVDQRIGGLLDAEPPGQGGSQQQAAVGDGGGCRRSSCRAGPGCGRIPPRTCPPGRDYGSCRKRHSPRSEGLSHNRTGTALRLGCRNLPGGLCIG
jgi:hypothetical protein